MLFTKDKSFYKLALTLAIPVILQNMITIGVNIMDTIMLGSYGEIQLSGSSLANELISLFQILCMGMGGGAGVLTAQYWGKKDIPALKRTVAIMLRFCLGIATVFTVATALFPEQLMGIYTNDPAVIEKGAIYFLVSLPTYLLMGISLTLTLILRSVRKMMVPLITSIICFFVNIFFNWVFIFGHLGAPEMQIAGAALGTVIARVVETAIIAVYVFKVDKAIAMRVRDLFTSCGEQLKLFFKYSIPVMISDSLLAFGNSAVSIIIGHISTEFVAANAIIATIVRLSTVFSGGLGSASATITGNAIGRGETERAYREGVTSVTLSVIIGLFAGVIILVLSPWIVSMYNITETTRAIAEQLMYAVAMMVVFQAMQGVLTKGVLRGGGDTHFLMVVDVLFLWLLSIPLGALCGLVWHVEPFFIYTALKIDWAIKSLWCLKRLVSRKWIKRVG